MKATRCKLPIGIQTFAKIREDAAYYYVDKTAFALDLARQGGYYFLSRPRRFGKSLFLDTLKELFEANESLFRGLHVHGHWDWSRPHPVIRISFGGGVLHDLEALGQVLHQHLEEHERRFELPARYPDPRSRLRDLIGRLHARQGAGVVVLVDEYDKPILDNLATPKQALAMREALKDIYSVLKDMDAHLRFVFLTGVSKFSKVSLFSGLNNLNDITLDRSYSAICGYTDADVDRVFAAELEGLDRDEIRRWYNGYNWLGEAVYNPFDLLLLFSKREFRSWWFETGTPRFLIQVLAERGFPTPRLASLQTGLSLLGRFDVEDLATEALLFQTGYLTIRKAEEPILGKWIFTLGYPNREVEISLNEAMLPALGLPDPTPMMPSLLEALRRTNFGRLEEHLKALFASIPHQWYTNNPIAQFEGYYASVFYSHFAALGLAIALEDTTHLGRIDMTVQYQGQIFLFEFKVVELLPEGRALQQLRDRRYADKYLAKGFPVHLIGVEFSRASRSLVGFEVARG